MGLLPADAPVVATDRELAGLLDPQRPETDLVVGLAGGDLCRTLGGRGDVAERVGLETTLAPVDVGVASLDHGPPRVFVAHLVARGRWWRGPALAAMNAEWLDRWRLAPRAHPGDGVLDLTSGTLAPRQLLLARRRARTGDHVPHPDLRQERSANHSVTFDRSRLVFLDGHAVGRHRTIAVRLVPRAVTVAV